MDLLARGAGHRFACFVLAVRGGVVVGGPALHAERSSGASIRKATIAR